MRQDAKSVENRTIVQHHKSNQERRNGEEYGRKEREREREIERVIGIKKRETSWFDSSRL